MKNLYLILNSTDEYSQTVFEFLKTAAEEKKIAVHPLYSDSFNFSEPTQLNPGDGLYKISTDRPSALIEGLLMRPEVVTFYSNYLFGVGKLDNVIECSMVHRKNELPIIPTIFSLTRDEALLRKYADQLGGFPIIVKSAWKKHGEGVMKIDSYGELKTTVNRLVAEDAPCILRQFIPHKRQARLIVLGDRVIASHENIPSIDFRSNVGNNDIRQRRVVTYEESVQQIAIKAVRCLGYEFGGVDILFHQETDEPYLAEVNLPCFFPTTQRMTGVDIAGVMVEYLVGKSERVGRS